MRLLLKQAEPNYKEELLICLNNHMATELVLHGIMQSEEDTLFGYGQMAIFFVIGLAVSSLSTYNRKDNEVLSHSIHNLHWFRCETEAPQGPSQALSFPLVPSAR